MYMWEPLCTTVQLLFNYQNYKSYVWNSYSTYYGGYFLENSKTRWCYKSKEIAVILIKIRVLSNKVGYKDVISITSSFGYIRYKKAPTEYCWVQTYVTYSYYEHSRRLLYKNMGMLLNRVREDGRPKPYPNIRNIRLFK